MKQLDREEAMIQHVTSDLQPAMRIHKLVALPNLPRAAATRALAAAGDATKSSPAGSVVSSKSSNSAASAPNNVKGNNGGISQGVMPPYSNLGNQPVTVAGKMIHPHPGFMPPISIAEANGYSTFSTYADQI